MASTLQTHLCHWGSQSPISLGGRSTLCLDMERSKEVFPSPVPADPPKLQRFGHIFRCCWAGFIILLLLTYPYRHAASLWRWPIPDVEPASPLPMKVFQVYPPVRVDRGYLPGVALPQHKKECEVLLIQHEFKFSYGKPAIGSSFLFPLCILR